MGGSWQQKKTTVEDCSVLDVNMLVRKRSISADNSAKGIISWTTEAGTAYEMEFECDRGRALRLRYQSGSKIYDYVIPLIKTPTKPFGGQHYWFLCPETDYDLERDQTIVCRKRVGKLYLPPGSTTFACRHCYNLTYRSCQTSHCRERLLASFGPPLGRSQYDF